MSSAMSYNSRKERAAAEKALLGANEHARVHVLEHGRLTLSCCRFHGHWV